MRKTKRFVLDSKFNYLKPNREQYIHTYYISVYEMTYFINPLIKPFIHKTCGKSLPFAMIK